MRRDRRRSPDRLGRAGVNGLLGDGAQTSRANSSLLEQPAAGVRRTRSSGPSRRPGRLERPSRASAPTAGASGRVERDAAAEPQRRGSTASAAAVAASSSSAPPGGRRGGRAVGRVRARPGSRRGAPRSSAASTPSKAWAPGPDRLVRPALPVGQVVAALVAGPGPVARSRSRAKPAAREPVGRRGRTSPAARSSSWPGRGRARASGGRRRRRQVVAARAGQALGVGVVEGQGVERQVVGLEGERRVERRAPSSPSVWPGTSYRRSRLTEAMPAARAARPRRRDVAGRWRRPRRRSSPAPGSGRRTTAGSRRPRAGRPGRRARPGPGWPRA